MLAYMIAYEQAMEVNAMQLILKKRAQKYLDSVDANTRQKLYKALDQLSRMEGDIKLLSGTKNKYRYKIAHYRILFEWTKGDIIIIVVEINTRTNIKY